LTIGRQIYVENTAISHPWGNSGACRSDDPDDLYAEVTDMRKDIQGSIMGVLLAAAAALLCAVVDHLTKEEQLQ
jgi:ribonuclease I